jgi:hypothetical protein
LASHLLARLTHETNCPTAFMAIFWYDLVSKAAVVTRGVVGFGAMRGIQARQSIMPLNFLPQFTQSEGITDPFRFAVCIWNGPSQTLSSPRTKR